MSHSTEVMGFTLVSPMIVRRRMSYVVLVSFRVGWSEVICRDMAEGSRFSIM